MGTWGFDQPRPSSTPLPEVRLAYGRPREPAYRGLREHEAGGAEACQAHTRLLVSSRRWPPAARPAPGMHSAAPLSPLRFQSTCSTGRSRTSLALGNIPIRNHESVSRKSGYYASI